MIKKFIVYFNYSNTKTNIDGRFRVAVGSHLEIQRSDQLRNLLQNWEEKISSPTYRTNASITPLPGSCFTISFLFSSLRISLTLKGR